MDQLADVVSAYRDGQPNILNSRSLVRKLAATRGISEAAVRSELVKAGAYVSLPVDKTTVSAEHKDILLERFREFEGDPEASEFYAQKQAFLHEVAKQSGYGKWALDDLDRKYRVLPLTAQEQSARRAFDEIDARVQAEFAGVGEVEFQTDEQSRLPPSKVVGVLALLIIGIVTVTFVTADDTSPSASYDASTDSPLREGTATTSDREKFADDLSPTPSEMTSEQSDRYDQLSPEGKEATDRAMEMYDAYCDGSSEC